MNQDAVQAELERIRKRHKGLLRPEDIVQFAKDKESALHAKFEWIDSEAAHEYRVWQARQLIKVFVQVDQPTGETIPVYVSLTIDRQKVGGGYRTLESILAVPELYDQLLEDALAEAERFIEKHRQLNELKPIFDAVKRVRRKRKTPAVTA